jgi:pyridoxal phosphate-dependent aminotransferase EpsN
MDPALLTQTIAERARINQLPKAVLVVHLYGQSADLDPILEVCGRYGITVIEDAAEALGATYHGRTPGTFGNSGIYSFNGNKIITTSGGGMLVSQDEGLIAHARKLSTQARDQAPWYQHSEIGYNYRLSNILAAIGRAQLTALEDRVIARRAVFSYYQEHLSDLPGLRFAPEAQWGRHTHWLTCITIDPDGFGCDREQVRLALAAASIESRPVWKPMHLQPIFADCPVVGGGVSERLFATGLCLPSGSSLTVPELDRVVSVIRAQAH